MQNRAKCITTAARWWTITIAAEGLGAGGATTKLSRAPDEDDEDHDDADGDHDDDVDGDECMMIMETYDVWFMMYVVWSMTYYVAWSFKGAVEASEF